MAAEMEFFVLGPLLVRRAGRVVPVPAGRQQALLAALLLSANRVIAVDELAEALWGEALPPSARASLQTYVMRLRRSLADASHTRITAHPYGYRIRVAAGELDADRFATLLAAARQAMRSGSYASAAARLRTALSLWRGRPLAGVQSETLALREVPRLAEMRLQAVEARIEADLHLRRHADVIAELRQLAAAEPLRERLHALLMLALYRDGQQAGALAAYRAARAVLVDELGTEPGPELRELHRQILIADPGLDAPAGIGAGDGPHSMARAKHGRQRDPVLPRQLPAAVPGFAGRAVELAVLAGLVEQASGAAGRVVILAIGGTAGVGKTALAVHGGHLVADRFPDGQLYVNLRGFDPCAEPVPPAQAVRLLLDGLGVAAEQVPAGLDARAGLYRSLLAGRRVLVVLDNARDAAQVRPLLPGSPGCLVLVTSRSQLTGLAAADGAHLLTLGVLSAGEAGELLAARLGSARVRAEPAAVCELSGLCARLPLALCIVAAQAAARPGLPLAALAAELRDTRTRLDALATGDAATDLRTVFSWSCEQLTGPAARMFRLFSVHPGPDITGPAAASLAGVPLPQARQALSELARAHLVAEHVPGRYACHDLLRAYAAELAAGRECEDGRRAALHRVLDHYLHTAWAASALLYPVRDAIALTPPQSQVRPEEFTGREQSLAWFHAERQVLLALISRAAAGGFDSHAWQLPWAVSAFLGTRGYWQELEAAQQSALAAARRLGDRLGQAEAHRHLGKALACRAAYAEAREHLSAALELGRQLGSLPLQARVHLDLSWAVEVPDFDALSHTQQALCLYRAARHRSGEADALNAIGWEHAQLGDYHKALDYCGQALALQRQLADRHGEATTLDSLGYAHHHLGHEAEAIACYQQAIDIHGDNGDLGNLAEMLAHLGDAHEAAGDHGAARDAWQHALAILDDLQHPDAGQLRHKLQTPGATTTTGPTGTKTRRRAVRPDPAAAERANLPPAPSRPVPALSSPSRRPAPRSSQHLPAKPEGSA